MKDITIRPKASKGEYKNTSIRLPEYLITYYDDLSAKTNRSRNELMECVLTEALNSITVEELVKPDK